MLFWFLAGVDLLSGILLFLIPVGPDFLRLLVAIMLIIKAILSFAPAPIVLPSFLMGAIDVTGGILLYLAFESIPLPDIITIVLVFTLVIKGISTMVSSAVGAMS